MRRPPLNPLNLLNLSYHESVGLKNKQIEVNYTRKGL